MLIKNAELDGNRVADVRCRQGVLSEIADSLDPFPGEALIDAKGGALLPVCMITTSTSMRWPPRVRRLSAAHPRLRISGNSRPF